MSDFIRKPKKIHHWRNFLDGACQVLVIAPFREYRLSSRGSFARDADAMRKDFARVALDMNSATREYERKHGERD